MSDEDQQLGEHRFTRRTALQSAAAAALGAGAATAGYSLGTDGAAATASGTIPYYGQHQAGIATPQQNFLYFTSFDFGGRSARDLRDLLRAWSDAAATMTAGRQLTNRHNLADPGPSDSGETLGVGASLLTVTIGLGRGLFEQNGRDRLGLGKHLPAELAPLPHFARDNLDPTRCGGDLCVQACADDPVVAFHAARALARIASPNGTRVRWTQSGFLRGSDEPASTPRNLLGFKDGTNNIRRTDQEAMRRFVWVAAEDGTPWMTGGSYLVCRRIRIWLDTWDATTLAEQERVIGREKANGAPLGARHEFDPVDLNARAHGRLRIPSTAHIRLAAPVNNHGERILRRGYSFTDPAVPGDGQLDAGLFFISFQRSVQRQFVPLQTRLARNDALNTHTQHAASALFACPPGTSKDGYIGETILE